MITAQVLEDNAGGIHWAMLDGRSFSSGGITRRDSNAGKLVAELVDLEEWIDDARQDHPRDADNVKIGNDGMTVIAEIDNEGVVLIYTNKMGVSGRIYAGLTP